MPCRASFFFVVWGKFSSGSARQAFLLLPVGRLRLISEKILQWGRLASLFDVAGWAIKAGF
jgi:hypothetical protein